jgi:hypothetical protein
MAGEEHEEADYIEGVADTRRRVSSAAARATGVGDDT